MPMVTVRFGRALAGAFLMIGAVCSLALFLVDWRTQRFILRPIVGGPALLLLGVIFLAFPGAPHTNRDVEERGLSGWWNESPKRDKRMWIAGGVVAVGMIFWALWWLDHQLSAGGRSL